MNEQEAVKGVKRIRKLAALVIGELAPLSEIEFGFNRASVEWVAGYIERQRKRRDPDQGVPEGCSTRLARSWESLL
jgi:hypothetical protein